MYTVKMCHSDWFNKKMNIQWLGRIFGAEKTLGRRKVEPPARWRESKTCRRKGKSHKSRSNM